MATAADLLQSATGVPRSDALLLLAKLLGVAKERLIAHPETVVSEKTQATFSDWIERVRGGFPTTYLLGTHSFWGRDFLVTPDVPIPRPDTETVIETVLTLVDSEKPFSILDLGTGSGAIAAAAGAALLSPAPTAVGGLTGCGIFLALFSLLIALLRVCSAEDWHWLWMTIRGKNRRPAVE